MSKHSNMSLKEKYQELLINIKLCDLSIGN
jgi:hypothetical protein